MVSLVDGSARTSSDEMRIVVRLSKISLANLLLLLALFCVSVAWWADSSELKQELKSMIATSLRVESTEVEANHFDRLNAAGVAVGDVAKDARKRLGIAKKELEAARNRAKQLVD